jgi:hypothetical protein
MKHNYFNKFFPFVSILFLAFSHQALASLFPEDSLGEDIWQLELGTQYVHQSNNLANLYGLTGASGSMINADSTNFLTKISELIAPDPEDVWGVAGRIGYVFESHKYDIQLRYFGVFSENDANNSQSIVGSGPVFTTRDAHYNLNTAELMFGLYHKLTRRLNARSSYGVAFASIDQKSDANLSSSVLSPFATIFNEKSRFVGAGPKVRVDGWFDLEDLFEYSDGFSIVGELGVAALLGNSEIEQSTMLDGGTPTSNHYKNELDQVAIAVDTTLGLKYAYLYEDSTINVEAGYKFAAYLNAFQDADIEFAIANNTESLFYNSESNYSYSGPYINVGVDFW